MNDRLFARAVMLRTVTTAEFLIALSVAIIGAAAAGAGAAPANVAEDPVATRLFNGVPLMIFVLLVLVSPLAVIRLATADRAVGWTAPVFAAGGSAITYAFALAASVSLASVAALVTPLLAFHITAGSFGGQLFAQILTGSLSLTVLCAYAAVLWVVLYETNRALLAMLALWLGPLGVGFYFAVAMDMTDSPLWLRFLLGLVPPVRLSSAFAPALVQAAYIAAFAGVLVWLAPRRLPVWP